MGKLGGFCGIVMGFGRIREIFGIMGDRGVWRDMNEYCEKGKDWRYLLGIMQISVKLSIKIVSLFIRYILK